MKVELQCNPSNLNRWKLTCRPTDHPILTSTPNPELSNIPAALPSTEIGQNNSREVGYLCPGWTILHAAALNGDVARVTAALQAVENPNTATTDEDAFTPLYIATLYDRLGAVCALLDAGANIDTVSGSKGATALFIAATKGFTKIVEELLKRGAMINYIVPVENLSPLIGAATGGHTPIVRLLIDAGADTSIQRADGSTALSIALTNKNLDMATILLERDRMVNFLTTGGS